MTKEELAIIDTPAFIETVRQNLANDPLKVALNRNIPHASLVATQVKYLQKAQKKLPTYYSACAILTQKSFEQSSSEQSAFRKHFTGDTCIDLTCGVGVDSLYLSKGFRRIVAVERDPVAAEIARINFKRMGVDNVEVVCDSAEEYLNRCPKADTIYIDPDRRDAGNNRLSALEECSPNVLELQESLLEKCDRLVIKCSPLFDVNEAFRLFGHNVRVNVISVHGECKEVLVEISESIGGPMVCATCDSGCFETGFKPEVRICSDSEFRTDLKCLLVPDVALRKARIGNEYMHKMGIDYFDNDSVGLSQCLHENFLGKQYGILQICEYKPKSLRHIVSKSAEILRLNFPYSTAQICKSTGIREGNGAKWMFCGLAGKLWAIEIKELTL